MGLMVRETTSIAKWGYEDGIERIVGWGVVPRMAPPPSQGDSTLRERGEREIIREREIEREND